jgi:protein-tyrosine phosphatase
MTDAVVMAGIAAATGTTTLVATPHIDHVWRLRPELIPQRAAALRQAMADAGIDLALSTGAEIALSRLADLTPGQLSALRLGDGPYVLLECPLSPTAGDFDRPLLTVRERGESIVLAHPERSPLFQQEPERLVRLVDAGMLCSICTGSLRGDFGQLVRRFTIELLREELVHDLASDAHDHEGRPPGLSGALALVESELPGITAQSRWLTTLAPAAILAGDPLPPRPARSHA